MNDMTSVIVPKSDQLNADDLIAGPRTITITGVKISPGTEQPVAISFDSDQGKPWKPCKSMSRVLVAMWGADAKAYAGRSVTLYRDPNVKWGGLPVGGIRISHMSHIDGQKTMALTETRGKRQPYVVKPLANGPAPKTDDPATKWTNAYLGKLPTIDDLSAFEQFVDQRAAKLEDLRGVRADLASQVDFAISQRRSELGGGDSFAADDEDDDGDDITFDPETPTEVSEHETKGELFTDDAADPLAEAKGKIDRARSEDRVLEIQDEYREKLSEADQMALSAHAMAVVAQKWPAE